MSRSRTSDSISSASALLSDFSSVFDSALTNAAEDDSVVGFKSIACFRTGLEVSPVQASQEDIAESLMGAIERYKKTGTLRLADKHFNDYLVRITMEIAGRYQKPGQQPHPSQN